MFKIIISILLIFFSLVSSAQEKNLNSFYYTGILKKKPEFKHSTDINKLYTPYYVNFNFKTDTCTIYHNKTKKLWDKNLTKFTIYHEASHCVLYQEALIFADNPDIFYLLLADSLNFQQDKKIGYMFFHELYADSLATALIIKEQKDLKPIIDMIKIRSNSPFGNHQTQDLLEKIIDINWQNKSIEEIKYTVLKMTENYFIEVWVKKYFSPYYEENKLPIYTKSLIKTFYGQHKRMGSEEKKFYHLVLEGFSDTMKNPNFKMLESMYKLRNEISEDEYFEKVCAIGPWC